MQVVTITKQGMNRKLLKTKDSTGGVFAMVPGKALRPAWSYGNPKRKTRDVMFQCPVSAIPDEVFGLLALWQNCRLTRTLPVAGGFLDQPPIVQRVFPIFEAEMRGTEQQGGNAEEAAALAVGAMVKAMGGGSTGGRKR